MEGTGRRGWWSRNWKWVIPSGCLGLILVAACFITVIVLLTLTWIKSSEVYTGALDAARSDAELAEAIGTPIEDGLFPTGSYEVSGQRGHTEFEISVSGPKGSATVYAVARKSAGEWTYTTLVADLDDSERRINLLDQTEPARTI